MAITKTMPPRPISDFLLNIILPLCPGHSVPQRLSTVAYPTQNRLPQFEYGASWMAIAKTVPPPPIFDFLPNIILPSHIGHSRDRTVRLTEPNQVILRIRHGTVTFPQIKWLTVPSTVCILPYCLPLSTLLTSSLLWLYQPLLVYDHTHLITEYRTYICDLFSCTAMRRKCPISPKQF
ncbi:hypothetical protein PILCRDRAFT_740486 [Piloderma croceum F 1598]|uniref:Uncharacterized protein n=1 Tax=Piloderma croceum (strain F 1598) TaxID=765440 RepID=A0A0C3EXI1_PILCF|nr:hypothetical protein PILCRDRAFT_740486 [Piloderma croceum F 1598]